MTRFMDVHHGMNGITAEQLRAADAADLAIEGEEGAPLRAGVGGPGLGHGDSLSEAPTKEAVLRVHDRTGHPADEIHPVPLSA